ncbi:hypothetical protein J2Z21_003610 [Streptomyces griseochromogenes]|uniref:Fe2OG dioxygenase domain-containing protein n=1 Tax=Streptomyces griseochromogenes TaxID=68214 RepID=A0A1B1B884_9ACTN|nr:hypothetical protein [Streptomyces griseochromogenes]ANP54942.1 hypothetical protein AVL59_39935 [Streptomyces griseochromogenes]MBP2050671.1 hypothetical protein [Streptomyces griseochromogenes]
MTVTADAMRTESGDPQVVTGWSGSPEYFQIREYQEFVPEAVVDVLHGRVAGVMFRGMVKPEVCTELAGRFWDSPHRMTRGVEAPGYYMGAYTWEKPTAQYLDDSEKFDEPLLDVLDVKDNPLQAFYQGLSEALGKEGAIVRRSRHEGRKGCRALLRSWHGAGKYALAPHDDNSQLTQPGQTDFEIQRVGDRPVAALNICLENSDGGRLVYWNMQADLESKRRLGVQYTGSAYPMETLEGIEQKWVTVNTGDVYVFNGSHIHAVEPNTDPELRRTSLAGMLGFIDDETVVSWT